MDLSLKIKRKLHQDIEDSIDVKIADIQKQMLETSESMKNDTKSSAGDKFETGREMLQIELNNKHVQLNKVLQLRQDLTKIDLSKTHTQIGFGSLVSTSMGYYYISVALGAFEIDDATIYALSLASPMGKKLNGSRVGASVPFQGKNIQVLQLV